MPSHKAKVEIRRYLYKEQNGNCYYCGFKFRFRRFTVDHIIPLSSGGTWSLDNCIGACERCNNEKSSIDVHLFSFIKNIDPPKKKPVEVWK